MGLSFTAAKKMRKIIGNNAVVAEIPNLISVQKESYESFLQFKVPAKERKNIGLENVFRSVFPIKDYEGKATLEFVKYELDKPKYDVEECIQRSVNYAAPLKATLQLVVWEIDQEAGVREVKSIKEQDVYMAEIPLMTPGGTFVINGAERVVVSQMHRSPGVFYDHDKGKSHSSGKFLYSARIIPYRGSWLDFEFDIKDILYFRIDRKRKIYITTLLKALGYNKLDILHMFYGTLTYKTCEKGWKTEFDAVKFKGVKIYKNIIDSDSGEIILAAGTKMTPRMIASFSEDKKRNYLVYDDDITGSYASKDILTSEGELILTAGAEITEAILNSIKEHKIKEIEVLDIDYVHSGPHIRNTLMLDQNETMEQALGDIYRVLRPGEPSTVEIAEALFKSTFFDPDRYDLASIGRMKINTKHNLNIAEDVHVLTKEDIIAVIKHLVELKDGFGEIDDIDNLGNRRVRSVGELVENHFRLGLVRMARSVMERLSSVEIDTVMPHDLVNAKVLMSVIREFFGSSQLSQFMDQTNLLAEITHKRRVSALGPGGLTRDRAGFEVRDVHPTHYGRICPIETPEGPNIGLINSLATYARINEYGFIESPYRYVENMTATNKVHYLSAIEEVKYVIAQSSAIIDESGKLTSEFVSCRKAGEIVLASPEEINYVDVSPKQLVSVAASLIPFLENDDASRALMGANMQRQAVPLIKTEAPLVGTGMESVVANDSGATVVAKRGGVVDQVDADRIVVRVDEAGEEAGGVDIYRLIKMKKSNQNTSINQKPIVKKGDRIKAGDIIADGPSTDLGELALGKNVLVAFMTWNGYNYEDSIALSSRMVTDDVFTSIHIQEFEVIARDTRLGPEDITRDLPNVNEEHLRHLDEIGVVLLGAEVKPGDILVGKVTPKSESIATPEEKLLRAIFGEKAPEVRDTSLRVPAGVKGVVIGVRVFTRRSIEKDKRAIVLERAEIERLSADRDIELEIIEKYVFNKAENILAGHTIVESPKQLHVGEVITSKVLESFPKRKVWQIVVKDSNVMQQLGNLKEFYEKAIEELEENFKHKVYKMQSGDDLPHGALKVVKIYIAVKQKIQSGDKMAGRHGNKGVVSRIIPIEDMPFLEDGTPIDVILNPLGVPSRMNVGQILETHLGWASAELGKQISESVKQYQVLSDINVVRNKLLDIYDSENDAEFREYLKSIDEKGLLELANNLSKGVPCATPVFEGAKEADIDRALKKANLPPTGQVTLIDGRSGEKFDRPITVGYAYMLKLDHLVDDKIHARSVGPYGLVTQQPLGGKAHFGGQRFGEMECWALQAYGAAYTLQEMLTIKSDDVEGRVKAYECIVKGSSNFEPGLPESFNVMVKELHSLGLNVEMLSRDDGDQSGTTDSGNRDSNNEDQLNFEELTQNKTSNYSRRK